MRSSMADLVTLVRDLIGDEAGADQVFSDNQVERALDVHRWEFTYLPLTPLASVVSGSTVRLVWVSSEKYWESDAVLVDANYNTLTPAVAEPLIGRWKFSSHTPSVRVSGTVYDPYGAAADLLEMWAGKTSLEFDFEADGGSYKRSQKSTELRSLAAKYREMQRVAYGRQVRDDTGYA